jgi:antitoxin HigA-1
MARTPIHPGEILADELKESGISAAQLARALDVPANRISQIIAGKRAVSADTALRLARYFRQQLTWLTPHLTDSKA